MRVPRTSGDKVIETFMVAGWGERRRPYLVDRPQCLGIASLAVKIKFLKIVSFCVRKRSRNSPETYPEPAASYGKRGR